MYLPYNLIREAKTRYYPPKEAILKSMSSGYEINEKILSEYAIETVKLSVK
jgi:hypothetical protein